MTSEKARWWSKDTVAVVTGGNKGIGFEIAKQLAQNGITTVLTSRDETRGRDAVKKLVDEGLPVVYHQLDVASEESAQKLANWLKEQYDAVDILVNNAGIFFYDNTPEDAAPTINTNFYGVKIVTRSILPLLRASEAGARMIIVSSRAGLLKYINKDSVRQTLEEVDKLSEEVLDKLVQEYYASLKEEPEKDKWAITHYHVSKALVNAYSRILAAQLGDRPPGQKVHVISYCPNWTVTDISEWAWGHRRAPPGTVWRTAAEGASDGVLLALSPASELQSDRFYLDGEAEDF